MARMYYDSGYDELAGEEMTRIEECEAVISMTIETQSCTDKETGGNIESILPPCFLCDLCASVVKFLMMP